MAGAGLIELMDRLRDCALGLLAGAPVMPATLRLRAGAAEIEMTWPGVASAPEVGVPTTDLVDGDQGHYVCAPTVGVFYRASEPGAKPFVEPGDVVSAGQQLGIVEVMKLMVPVEADLPGRIERICGADGEPVEYGDRLFLVTPSGKDG
ncbi:hypothetical protein ED92_40130 [Amycolatopsis sp. MJM2582]|nr:hypothetical protein ED92_40130 [Amycolatopsis sp. MJM2582]